MFEQEIDRVVRDLQGLVGVPLVESWQPSRDRVVLGWKNGTLLVIVPRGPHARLHTIERRPPNPAKPFSFQGLCRSRLGGVTVALAKSPGEREVVLRFSGDTDSSLVVRLSGKSSGLWLLEGDRVVASIDGPAPDALPPLPARIPLADAPRFGPVDGSWDLGARVFFTAREAAGLTAELRAAAARALGVRQRRDLRLLEHLRSDLQGADEASVWRRRAELLSANLWRVPRGAATVEVEDWDSGETSVLTWTPGVSPAAAMERWFAQARRLERAAVQIHARIGALEQSIAATALALARVDDASEEDLRRWRGERPTRVVAAAGFPWRTWVGPRGEHVRIGWNEAGNRRLVFQLARGHHVWMHLRDRPSAHVVLELAKGSSATLEHLLAAAQILLGRSGFEVGDAADVQYAWVRDVRAVPGPHTRVTVSGEKVLRVVSDAALLEGWTRSDA